MEDYNKKEEKKGLLPLLSRLFGSGTNAASSLGKAAGGAGLFSTKAGLVGIVLGGATIAAGIGVIYNFIGPSSSKVYTPDLFQNSYYEEQAQKANTERISAKQATVSAPSTIDMFREQAKKEGLGTEESSNENTSSEGGNSSASSQDVNVPAPENTSTSGGGTGGSGGKLQASLGFGNKGGGGSSAAAPRLQTSGGLFGGIGQQFAPVYRPGANQANSGQAGNMKGALASKITNSPRYAVPNINRKGAYGQAKFAKAVGLKANYAASVSGAKSQAGIGFDAGTTGTGDVGTPEGGVGLGGAGAMDGPKLKGNDPNLSNSEIQPPTPQEKTPDNPYQKLLDYALYGMLGAMALIWAAKALAKAGQFMLAKICAMLAMVAAGIVILAGIGLFTGKNVFGGKDFDPQKMMGMIYLFAGGLLMYQAAKALSDISDAEEQFKKDVGNMQDNMAKKYGAQTEDYKNWEKNNPNATQAEKDAKAIEFGKKTDQYQTAMKDFESKGFKEQQEILSSKKEPIVGNDGKVDWTTPQEPKSVQPGTPQSGTPQSGTPQSGTPQSGTPQSTEEVTNPSPTTEGSEGSDE